MFQTHCKLLNFYRGFYCKIFIERLQILNNTKKKQCKL